MTETKVKRSPNADRTIRQYLDDNSPEACIKVDRINRKSIMRVLEKMNSLLFKMSSYTQRFASEVMTQTEGVVDSTLLRQVRVDYLQLEAAMELLLRAGNMEDGPVQTPHHGARIRNNMVMDLQYELDLRVFPELRE